MNYLLKNSRRASGARKPFIGTALVLALAAFFYFFAPKFANQNIYAVARPIWRAQDYIAAKLTRLWSVFSDKERLASDNAALQKELEGARLALLDLDGYKKENDELKKILSRSPEKRIPSSILAKPNRSAYDTLVLDVGKNQAVKEGDSVYAGDFIIGAVREVYDNYSKATLASSPGETFTVRVGNGNTDVEAVGRGGGNFIAKLPKEIPVKQGDLIKSPGLQPKFFGAVENIEKTETGSFQFILFKLPVNVNDLDWVEVARGQ